MQPFKPNFKPEENWCSMIESIPVFFALPLCLVICFEKYNFFNHLPIFLQMKFLFITEKSINPINFGFGLFISYSN